MNGNGQAVSETGRMMQARELPWRNYRRELLGYIRARVREQEAEDILQDVLLKAWQGLGKLHEEKKLVPWLYGITRNAIVDHYRRRASVEPLVEEELLLSEPEENRAEQELAACLIPMIGLLPEKYGRAVRLAELEGKKGHEIAALENISLSGAKSRVQRGRGMLRELLEECCRIECNSRGGVVDYRPRNECSRC